MGDAVVQTFEKLSVQKCHFDRLCLLFVQRKKSTFASDHTIQSGWQSLCCTLLW